MVLFIVQSGRRESGRPVLLRGHVASAQRRESKAPCWRPRELTGRPRQNRSGKQRRSCGFAGLRSRDGTWLSRRPAPIPACDSGPQYCGDIPVVLCFNSLLNHFPTRLPADRATRQPRRFRPRREIGNASSSDGNISKRRGDLYGVLIHRYKHCQRIGPILNDFRPAKEREGVIQGLAIQGFIREEIEVDRGSVAQAQCNGGSSRTKPGPVRCFLRGPSKSSPGRAEELPNAARSGSRRLP